jgi:hypothetical protein
MNAASPFGFVKLWKKKKLKLCMQFTRTSAVEPKEYLKNPYV